MSDRIAARRPSSSERIMAGGPLSGEGPGVRQKARAVAVVLLGLCLFVFGMIVSYSEALVHPALDGAQVAVAGDANAIVALEQNESLDLTVVADDDAARSEVEHRDADAAIVIGTGDGATVTTYVATGASPALARAVNTIGTEIATNTGTTNELVDLAAPSPNNPNATLEFYVVIFLTIGGSVGATIFGRVLGSIRTARDFLVRCGVLVLNATILAGGAAFYATQIIDGITGEHGLAFFGALWVYLLAVGGAVSGIASLGGTIAGAVVSVLFVVLGNSASGGPFGVHMLNDFFQAVHWITPQTWGLELLRDIEYFDGNGMARPLTALAIWGVVGLVTAFLGMLRHTLRGRREGLTTPVTPVAPAATANTVNTPASPLTRTTDADAITIDDVDEKPLPDRAEAEPVGV